MLINLTPHTINIHLPNGTVRELPPSGAVARIGTKEVPAGEVDGIPVVRSELTAPEGLPEPAPGTWFVVSRIVLDACRSREDLLAPGALVRNAAGQPCGCKGLAR